MAKNRDNEYYTAFETMSNYASQIAKELEQTLKDFTPASLTKKMEGLHRIEQSADETMHDLHKKLAKEFIAPIERGDILGLVGQLDDVVDGIEDILIKIYMFNVQAIRPEAVEFAGILVRCCAELTILLKEFRNFKKSSMIKNSIIEINRLEEVGDKLYMQTMRKLYQVDSSPSPVEVIVWTEIYALMELCCDTCEHTANLVEEIIMKNM